MLISLTHALGPRLYYFLNTPSAKSTKLFSHPLAVLVGEVFKLSGGLGKQTREVTAEQTCELVGNATVVHVYMVRAVVDSILLGPFTLYQMIKPPAVTAHPSSRPYPKVFAHMPDCVIRPGADPFFSPGPERKPSPVSFTLGQYSSHFLAMFSSSPTLIAANNVPSMTLFVVTASSPMCFAACTNAILVFIALRALRGLKIILDLHSASRYSLTMRFWSNTSCLLS